MTNEFGVCKFCGQTINIRTFLEMHKDLEDPDEDGIATLMCDCEDARRARESYEAHLRGESERHEAIVNAEDIIEQLFRGNAAIKRAGLDDDEREILRQIAERTYDGFIEKATIVTTNGVKASVRACGNGLKIERSETKKEAVNI